MIYVNLVEQIVASDLVRNALLLAIVIGIWKVQDIIRSLITMDYSDRGNPAIRAVTNQNRNNPSY